MQKQAGHRLLTTYIVVLRKIPYICRYPIPIQNFTEYTGYHRILGKQCFSPFLFFLCKKKKKQTWVLLIPEVGGWNIWLVTSGKINEGHLIQFHLFPLGLEPVYKGHALFTPGSLSGNLLILGSFCNYLVLSSNFFFF